jgi:hypothetical protein
MDARWPLVLPDGTVPPARFPQQVRTTVHIDSRDRNFDQYPGSSQFAVDLPEPLKNVASAALVSAELPLSYYVFSAARGNTSLTVAVDGAPQTVAIPDGNYTTASMAAALGAALTGAFSTAVTVAFDPASMKCSVSAGAGAVVAVDTTGDGPGRTGWGLGYYLGFARGAVTAGPPGGAATGARVASLSPENYLLVEIEELNGVAAGGRRCFAKVPLNGDHYQYQYYDKTLGAVELRPHLGRLERLRVSIRLHDGTLVDLNGGEWSMSIEFTGTLVR